jgi:hypothetical protein
MEKVEKIIPTNFIASTYGEMTQEGNNFSRVRMRVFYTGINRNSTLITNDFAEQLIKSAYGQPIVGHYDLTLEDFTDHATKEATKPYGFVPNDLNFAWEDHLDDDGIMRTYACFDVLLWTGRYEYAGKILNNPQSMELDPKSINGAWKVINGDTVFEYETGHLYGFCVLGKEVEPCFEGARFFALESDFKLFFEDMREFTLSQFAIERDKVAQGGRENLDEKVKLLEKYKLTQETIEFNITEMTLEELQTKLDAEFSQNLVDLNDNKGKDPKTDLTHLNFTYKEVRDKIAQLMPYSLEVDDATEKIVGEISYCLMNIDNHESYAYVEKIVCTGEGCTPTIGRFKFEKLEDDSFTISGEWEEITPQWMTSSEYQQRQEDDASFLIKYNDMEKELKETKAQLTELEEFKVIKNRESKMEIVDSFKEILTEEDMAPVLEKIDEYSLEEIDVQLSAIAFKKASIKPNHKFIYNKNNTDVSDDSVIALLQKHKKS